MANMDTTELKRFVAALKVINDNEVIRRKAEVIEAILLQITVVVERKKAAVPVDTQDEIVKDADETKANDQLNVASLILDYCAKKGDREASIATVQVMGLIWLHDLSSVKDIKAYIQEIVKLVESPERYIDDQKSLGFRKRWVDGMCDLAHTLGFLKFLEQRGLR